MLTTAFSPRAAATWKMYATPSTMSVVPKSVFTTQRSAAGATPT
jgi:hypothetical protein